MLSVNRYRIRHRAQSGDRRARALERLLQKPDDWLGANLVILAGASVFASAIATILAQRTGQRYAVPLAGVAADDHRHRLLRARAEDLRGRQPGRGGAARRRHLPRAGGRRAPGAVAHQHARLRVPAPVRRRRATTRSDQSLSAEELRTVVTEAAPVIPARHRQMLLSILDLGRITVNDIMVPRQEIAGIDVSERWEDILDAAAPDPAYPAAGVRGRAGQPDRPAAHEARGAGAGARHPHARAPDRGRPRPRGLLRARGHRAQRAARRTSSATAAASPSWSTSTGTSRDW